jgi:hypothetical protein
VTDPGPPGTEQVADRDRAAFGVVGDEGEVPGVGRGGHRVDDGDRDVAADRLPGVLAAAGHDDAVDPAFEQGAQVVLLPDLVVPAVAQQNRDAPGAERVLRALHDRDAEPAEAVGGNQPHREGAAGEQPAGQRVRLVAELLGCLLDALDGAERQGTASVERLGYRARRDPGQAGHVGDGRGVLAGRIFTRRHRVRLPVSMAPTPGCSRAI